MLADNLLRSVSRSFYLSIRILPGRLREPVALAYLLARSTDTVADTSRVGRELRIETLRKLSDIIQGTTSRVIAGIGNPGLPRADNPPGSPPPATDDVVDLIASFAPLQENAVERKLLESLPDSVEWLERLSAEDRGDVRAVLDKITQGQMLDLEKFDDPNEICALATAADLDRYTYLVAGCVGEFWTRLCFRHLRNFALLSEAKMLALGKEYGMGLQLINILRDAGDDLRARRCYFPDEELGAARLPASQILREPERFQPIYRKWLDKAQRGLDSGVQYARAIRNRRVRAATALPALIGVRTLAILRNAGPTALHRHLKVSRKEVRGMILSLALTCASRTQIGAIFKSAKL